MILKSVHIYGFGKYQDMTFYFSPGMNVIEGKNEAGKSTLLSFVKAILFGFESRRLPEMRFEPLEGGKFGGSLTLEDAQGQIYWIERTNQRKSQGWVRVMMPDGTEQGEEIIPRLLNGMTSTFYMNIFAFGLTELSYLASLNQEEVSNYFYHSGTGVSQQQLKKSWMEEMERLFKPRGNQPSVNRHLNKLEELNQQISSIQKENESYNRVLLQKEKLDRMITEGEERLRQIQKEQKRWEKMKETFPIWQELKIWLDRLQQLPVIRDFPENGISRLEELDRQIRELSVDWEGDLLKIEELECELSSVSLDPHVLAWEEEIDSLSFQSTRWIEKKEQQAALMVELHDHHRELQRYISELGNEWNVEKLAELDVSLSKKELFREQRQLFHGLATSLQALVEMIQTKEEEAKELETQYEQVQADVSSHDSVAFLPQWEEHWMNYQQISHALDSEQKQLDWVKQQWNEESQRRQQIKSNKEREPRFGLSILCLLLGAAGGGWFYFQSGISAGIILPIALGILLAMMVWRSGIHKQKKDQTGPTSYHLQHLNQKRQELDHSVSEKKNQLAKLSTQVFHGEHDMRNMKQSLHYLRQQRESYLQLKDQMQWLQEKMDHSLREIEKLNKKRAAIQTRLQEERDHWNQLLLDFHMPLGLSPDGALDILTLAGKAKECLEKHNLLKDKIHAWEKDWKHFADQVLLLGQETKVTIEMGDPWRILQILQRRQKEEKESQTKRDELSRRMADQDDLRRKREGMLRKLKEERLHLVTTVGVSDGELFRKAYQQFVDRRQSEEKVRILRHTLQSASVDKELENQISFYSLEEIEEERERTTQEWDQQNQALQELLDQRGQYRNKLEQLESGENLSILIQQQQELLAEVEEAGRKWIVLRLAQQVLEQTRESYEAQKQPGVIREASTYFAKMTQGKYPRILSPIGEQRLIVERKDGVRIEPGFLSRGTKEQLFLSLRFALMKACEKSETLPILLDDIFVNFDEGRTLSGIQALEDLAREHQVLFFTCHSHVVKSIQATLPQANCVNLNQMVSYAHGK